VRRDPDQDRHHAVADKVIWGATARILGELFERLDRPVR
jgi:hypothetical protein